MDDSILVQPVSGNVQQPVLTDNSNGQFSDAVAQIGTRSNVTQLETVAPIIEVPDNSVPSSTDSASVRSPSSSPSPSPSPPTYAPPAGGFDSSVPPLSGDVPMEVDDHAGPVTPMEVDNHASLDGSALAISLADSMRESSVNLDTLDFSKVPEWLRLPLRHLNKKFRGELEDNVLRAFVELEMAWKPVRVLFYFLSLYSSDINL